MGRGAQRPPLWVCFNGFTFTLHQYTLLLLLSLGVGVHRWASSVLSRGLPSAPTAVLVFLSPIRLHKHLAAGYELYVRPQGATIFLGPEWKGNIVNEYKWRFEVLRVNLWPSLRVSSSFLEQASLYPPPPRCAVCDNLQGKAIKRGKRYDTTERADVLPMWRRRQEG